MMPGKIRYGFLIALVVVGGLLVASSRVPAAEFIWDDEVTVNEPTDGTLFVGGQDLEIQAPVRGDLYCLGQSVFVDTRVAGDIICGGQRIRVTGLVEGSVRGGAQSVVIGDSVGASVSIGAQEVLLLPTGRTGGDFIAAATDVDLQGSVGRDVIGAAESLTVSGTVSESAWVSVTRLTLRETGRIGADLNYWSNREWIPQGDTFVIGGTVNFYQTGETTVKQDVRREGWFGFEFWSYLYLSVALLVVGYVLAYFEGDYLDDLVTTILDHPGPAFGWGLVTCFVPPPLMVLLSVMVVGMPLAFLSGIAWILIIAVSSIVTAVALGRFTLRKIRPDKSRTLWAITLGIPLFGLLSYLPWIGWLIVVLAVITGAGAIFRTTFLDRY